MTGQTAKTIESLKTGFRKDWTFEVVTQNGRTWIFANITADGRRGEIYNTFGQYKGSWSK